MLIFSLTIQNLWGRVLEKFQEARAVAYADDGYIKGKLSAAGVSGAKACTQRRCRAEA